MSSCSCWHSRLLPDIFKLTNLEEGEAMKKIISLAVMMGVILFTHPSYSQTWGASRRLTWTPASSQDSGIAVDSNNHIHVAWQEITAAEYDIFYKRSTDAGATWDSAKRLSWKTGHSALYIIFSWPTERSFLTSPSIIDTFLRQNGMQIGGPND